MDAVDNGFTRDVEGVAEARGAEGWSGVVSPLVTDFAGVVAAVSTTGLGFILIVSFGVAGKGRSSEELATESESESEPEESL